MSTLRVTTLKNENSTSNNIILDSTGYVGIGGQPSTLLHMVSTGPAIFTIEADTDNVTETDNPRIVLKQDGGVVVARMGYESGANHFELVNEYSGGALSLGTNNTKQLIINSGGQITKPYQASFHAYGVANTANNIDMVFPTLVFNVGNHYNTSTGRFTAPIAGTYMFGWTTIAGNSDTVRRYYFRVNGSNIGDLHLRMDMLSSGSEYATNAMFTIPWQLNAGDYVNIYYTSDNSTAQYGTSANDYPRFWGYLLG